MSETNRHHKIDSIILILTSDWTRNELSKAMVVRTWNAICMNKAFDILVKLSQDVWCREVAQSLFTMLINLPLGSGHPLRDIKGCGPTLEAKICSLFHQMISNIARSLNNDKKNKTSNTVEIDKYLTMCLRWKYDVVDDF